MKYQQHIGKPFRLKCVHRTTGQEVVLRGVQRSEIGSVISKLPSPKGQGTTASHVRMLTLGEHTDSANTPQSWGQAPSQHTLIQIQWPMLCLQILMSALFFY